MTYPLRRRYDIRSIGMWIYPIGRPTSETAPKWKQSSNFVFKVKVRVDTLEDSFGENGWILEVYCQDNTNTKCFVPSTIVSSTASLNKHLMRNIPGAVSQLKSHDFLDFIAHDDPREICHCVSHVGKITINRTSIWVFQNMCLDSNGDPIEQNSKVILSATYLHANFVLPTSLPSIRVLPRDEVRHKLEHLGRCIRDVYPRTYMQVLHLLASTLKAIHFDALIADEKFVSVCNVSGPANVGKTLACAIALRLVESQDLMLSRCTLSSMLDYAHVFKNMLIVWDDPRNTSPGQLSSVVHEAFNGVASSTVTKGRRQYNSTLIIGTQECLLGMETNDVNMATFSRLSHIDFNLGGEATSQAFNYNHEKSLQKALHDCNGTLSFLINKTQYDKASVDKLHKDLNENNIIGRAIRIASIDKYFIQQLGMYMNITKAEINEYFDSTYMPFLRKHCSRISAFDHFLLDVSNLINSKIELPANSFKSRVMVDLKECGPTECFAFYSKTFFDFMSRQLGSISYTKETVHSHIKHNHKIGEVSRNVAYKIGDAVVIKRGIVIRRVHLQKLVQCE